MLHVFAQLTLAVLTAATSAGSTAHHVVAVNVIAGTPVQVQIIKQLSSTTVKKGDIVPIRAASGAVARGWLIVAAGATGQAHVKDASSARRHGKNGFITLQFDWITAVDGSQIALSAIDTGNTAKPATGTSTAAHILPRISFFSRLFGRGKDVTVKAGQLFSTYVDFDITVKATRRAKSPAPHSPRTASPH